MTLAPWLIGVCLATASSVAVRGQPIDLTLATPTMDRWMYPHNASPGARSTAPVFGTLGDEAGVDSRHGQFLVGFDLAGLVTPHLGPSRYLLRQCRLSVMVSRHQSFLLDPTPDAPSSYLPAGHPDLTADPDPGRPIELFGVGYRNGFTAESFAEDSPFGRADMGQRNAYAAGFDPHGALIDVGNNVGKTNVAFPVFEAHPFAVGTSATVTPGDLVPAGTVLDFELNLTDPLVAQYLQEACHTGRLRLMLTSLQTSGFGGQPAWTELHTRESVLGDPPRLVLSGTAVRPEDTDGDGLPDDWERHFFGSLAPTAAEDADHDGLPNGAEWEAGTHPDQPGDVLALAVTVTSAGNTTAIRFRAAPSRRYALLTSADLLAWEPVADAEPVHELGTGWARFTWPEGASPAARFFQVRATPVTALE